MPEVTPVPSDPVPLATADMFIRRFPDLCEGIDPILIQEACVEATSHLEEMVSRRLAPFTGMIYQDRLRGIDPTEYGDESADLPIDIYGALGISYAYALGANNLVRHIWLPDYAPFMPELWTTTINSMHIVLTYGNTQNIDFLNGGIVGPDSTDGHIWLRLGTFAPEGTRVYINYSGGYTLGIPPALRRACLYQAAKFVILDYEPQQRRTMSLEDIDAQIMRIMVPWYRG